MRAVAARTFKTPHEGIRAAGLPERVELRGVPGCFVGYLGYADGVGGWAGGGVGEAVGFDGISSGGYKVSVML